MRQLHPPNIHDILRAIRELEKLPVIQAYNALIKSLKPTEEQTNEDKDVHY
jgi:hypothetical protein